MENFVLYSIILLWVFQLFVGFALVLLFRQFGLVYLRTGEAVSRDGIAVGKTAPQETLPLAGRRSVVVFVSPDCGPCRELLLQWNGVVARYRDRIRFVLIVAEGAEPSVGRLLPSELQGQLIMDEGQRLLRAYQVRVTPFGFALDEEGIVRGKGLCGGSGHLEQLIGSLEQPAFQGVGLAASNKQGG